MHSFKSHYFRNVFINFGQQLFEVFGIIVAENMLGSATIANTLNHGGVISGVRKYVHTCGKRRFMLGETGVIFNLE